MPPQPPFPINDFDDHGKHVDAHNRFRKSQSYEQLDPVQKAIIDEHVNAHVNALMGGMPSTMAGSTMPSQDSPTGPMQDPNSVAMPMDEEMLAAEQGADNYAGPEQDSVTGSELPPSGG